MNIVTKLRSLRTREHACTVEIIAALVDCQRERSYLEYGCSSIFDFLVQELKYSNAAASRRNKAMKVAARFPQVLEMLRDHLVSLSTLAQAEGLLGEVSNPEQLLDRLSGKSARQVEKIVAHQRPVPRKPRESVRPVAVKAPLDPLFVVSTGSVSPAESRVSLRTTLCESDFEEFERVRSIVSRKRPGATVEDVLVEMTRFYLKQKAPKKRGAPKEGSATKAEKAPAEKAPVKRASADVAATNDAATKKPATNRPRSRHIPRPIRDEVMLRDGQQCTFVGHNARRCNSTHNLQIDHIKPWALGGKSEAANLRVLCAAHNRHQARKTFGNRVPTSEQRSANSPKPLPKSEQ